MLTIVVSVRSKTNHNNILHSAIYPVECFCICDMVRFQLTRGQFLPVPSRIVISLVTTHRFSIIPFRWALGCPVLARSKAFSNRNTYRVLRSS